MQSGVYEKAGGSHFVHISPDTLRVTAHEVEEARPWHTIREIVITDGYAYLFVTPSCSIVVPQTCIF